MRKNAVENNHERFFRLTEFATLSLLLSKYNLVTITERKKLISKDSTLIGEEKASFFYLEVLPSKGMEAYTRLHKCLAEEKQHLGHEELLALLDAAIEELERQENDDEEDPKDDGEEEERESEESNRVECEFA